MIYLIKFKLKILEDTDLKEKQNMYRSLLEKKLKHIYSQKPNLPRIEFRNLSGASLFYGTIKLKVVLEPSSPDNLKGKYTNPIKNFNKIFF